MRKVARWGSALLLTLSLAGCTQAAAASFARILAQIALAIAQAEPEIAVIEAAAAAFFAVNPNAGTQAEVAAGIDKLRAALALAAKTVDGLDDLSQADVDAALADFRAAWTELSKLLQDSGVVQKDGKFALAPHGAPERPRMPDPIALHLKVRR